MTEPVELIPAFLWTCPECGIDNFERTIVAELSEEEMQELRDDHNLQPWDCGEFLRSPTSVVCPQCENQFPTREYGEES